MSDKKNSRTFEFRRAPDLTDIVALAKTEKIARIEEVNQNKVAMVQTWVYAVVSCLKAAGAGKEQTAVVLQQLDASNEQTWDAVVTTLALADHTEEKTVGEMLTKNFADTPKKKKKSRR